MNHSKLSAFCTLVLTMHATTLSMNYDPYDPTHEQSGLPSSQLRSSTDGDQLWDSGKIVPISPKPSPSKFFALHDLIQNPDTHTTNTQELLTTVERLLKSYPKYLTITNRNEQSAYTLLLLQLQKPDLSTQ